MRRTMPRMQDRMSCCVVEGKKETTQRKRQKKSVIYVNVKRDQVNSEACSHSLFIAHFSTYIHWIENIAWLVDVMLYLLWLLLRVRSLLDDIVMEWPAEAHLGLWVPGGGDILYSFSRFFNVFVLM